MKPAAALLAVLAACAPCALAQSYEQKIRAAVSKVDAVAAKGPFQPSWDSMRTYKAPDWYQDAKFGIFIHWGAYSVPAFGNEWYPRNMYLAKEATFQHHIATFGPQSKFGYKDFLPRFRAENFDAAHWADVFKRSGARYVVPVAEHHDGFPMYDCSFTDWSAAKMGPTRDVVGELASAVRKQDLRFGCSSHRAEHWWFFNGGMTFDSDVRDPKYAGLYGPAKSDKVQPDRQYLDDWLSRTSEIVDKYQPDLVWFDWWIEQPAFQPYLQRFAAFYYNRGVEWNRGGTAINYKKKAIPEGRAVYDIERGKLDNLRSLFWQTDTSVGEKSWGYIEGEKYRTPGSLIGDLVDIVSKNGCLLLNIGPRPDGAIPEQVEKILLEMGRWLDVNGEAIYGTRPWKVYGEGPTKVVGGSFKDTASQPFTGADIRFTTKGDTLYAVALAWPRDGKLVVKSLGTRPVKSVELLGSSGELKWRREKNALVVDLPAQKPGDYAYAFRIR